MADFQALDEGRSWIASLGGQGVPSLSYAVSPALAVGHFRFNPLIEEVEAPSLPFHYVSVTLGSPLRIDANVGGRRVNVRVRKGQSMIMAAGRYNSWRWDGPTEDAFVFLRPDYLKSVAEEAGAATPEIADRFVFEDVHLRRTVLAIAAELAMPGGPSSLFLDMAAQSLAMRLLHRHCEPPLRAASAMLTAAQLRRVVDLVEGGLGGPIDLEALADAAGVSRFHFARSFRATTGQPPHKWLTARRVDHAKTLLERTKRGMIEIAAAVGFESQSHFGQVFKAHTGLTPSDWRAVRIWN